MKRKVRIEHHITQVVLEHWICHPQRREGTTTRNNLILSPNLAFLQYLLQTTTTWLKQQVNKQT